MGPKLKTSKGATRRQKMMREIFNDVIMCKDITPDAWKRVRITEVFKKSDVERADNNRPICTLPTLYKSVFNTSLQQALQQA